MLVDVIARAHSSVFCGLPCSHLRWTMLAEVLPIA